MIGFLLQHSVDASAARDPHHVAFRCAGSSLSYGELQRRSDQLASYLYESGVRRGDRVGLYLHKSLDMPIALYGVLKAGAAYVPIDPAAPRERVRFLLQDCAMSALVTGSTRSRQTRDLLERERPESLRCVLGIDEDMTEAKGLQAISWTDLEQIPAQAPDVRLVDEDLAYVMVTSGSTGVPKGLMHTHRSGLAYARLSAREYGVVPEDRLGNHSPLHFDMSTFEFLTGPFVGATSVLIPEETILFPRSVAQLIEDERLTFWYSVPLALIQLLLQGGLEDRDHSSLRWVLFGGEPFPPKHLARLMEHWPQARFSNSYGPAEVNQCTAYHLPSGPLDEQAPVPLGTVWSGAEGLIVNPDDEPVATGDEGELLIRAPTMMKGYWGRPDLNREAFFVRRRLPEFEEVFYRTGDLVREDDQGLLHFLGRLDRQVKVRGQRVELDEVENVLAALDGVAEAGVVAVRDVEENVVLCAAVRREPDEATTPREIDAAFLRRGCAERLPGYAVPSRWRVSAQLPRTGSGKIDRRQLAEDFANEL